MLAFFVMRRNLVRKRWLLAVCEVRGYSVEEMLQVKEFKREKRGGFKDKIYWIGNEK